MRNLFHRILSALNLNRRDWVVFLLALLLAFSIWLIHNLSLNYNDYFSVSLIAESNIPGHAVESVNKCEVTARCRATGYKLIRARLGRGRAHKVQLRAADLTHYEDDMFYMLSSDLQGYSHVIFGPGVSVEYFVSDTLFFRFPFENCKKVPVTPISVVSYTDQYMGDGGLTVTPDSIYVYGEPSLIEKIDEVFTRQINYRDLSEDVVGMVGIEKIKGVRTSVDQVRYSLKVKRFVEIELNLPVKVVNVPHGKVLRVYPSEVNVKLRCNFPLIGNPENTVTAEVDYETYSSSLSGKCPVTLTGMSRGVIEYSIEPTFISGIAEEVGE